MTAAKRAAIKKLIERHTRLTTATSEAARDSLVKEGIHTPDGKLAPEYRIREEAKAEHKAGAPV
jgi:hypothetical protein